MTGDFEVDVERQDSTVVVSPAGEIDLATVGLVRQAVEREQHSGDDVVLDLRGVGFLDTSGLRYVLEVNERAARDGFTLHVVRGPRAVQRVFEVAGVESRLPFVDDHEAAAEE